MGQIGSDTVTVLTAQAAVDGYTGRDRADWTDPVEVDVAGCSVQPVTGSEDTFTRDEVTWRWQCWGPVDMSVTAASRVRWDGQVYEVDGPIQKWTGRLAHVTFFLKVVTG